MRRARIAALLVLGACVLLAIGAAAAGQEDLIAASSTSEAVTTATDTADLSTAYKSTPNKSESKSPSTKKKKPHRSSSSSSSGEDDSESSSSYGKAPGPDKHIHKDRKDATGKQHGKHTKPKYSFSVTIDKDIEDSTSKKKSGEKKTKKFVPEDDSTSKKTGEKVKNYVPEDDSEAEDEYEKPNVEKPKSKTPADEKDDSWGEYDTEVVYIPGRNGKDGVDGKDGANGKPGKDGAAGPAGADGANGEDGDNGSNGTDGMAVAIRYVSTDYVDRTFEYDTELNQGHFMGQMTAGAKCARGFQAVSCDCDTGMTPSVSPTSDGSGGQARSWFERANSIRIVRNALISKDSEDKNTCACAALYSATVAEPARDDDSDEEEEDSSSSSSDVDGSGDSSSGEEDSSGGAKPPTPPNKRMFGNSRREAPGEESTGDYSSDSSDDNSGDSSGDDSSSDRSSDSSGYSSSGGGSSGKGSGEPIGAHRGDHSSGSRGAYPRKPAYQDERHTGLPPAPYHPRLPIYGYGQAQTSKPKSKPVMSKVVTDNSHDKEKTGDPSHAVQATPQPSVQTNPPAAIGNTDNKPAMNPPAPSDSAAQGMKPSKGNTDKGATEKQPAVGSDKGHPERFKAVQGDAPESSRRRRHLLASDQMRPMRVYEVDAEDTNYDSLKKSSKYYEQEDEDDDGYWDQKDKGDYKGPSPPPKSPGYEGDHSYSKPPSPAADDNGYVQVPYRGNSRAKDFFGDSYAGGEKPSYKPRKGGSSFFGDTYKPKSKFPSLPSKPDHEYEADHHEKNYVKDHEKDDGDDYKKPPSGPGGYKAPAPPSFFGDDKPGSYKSTPQPPKPSYEEKEDHGKLQEPPRPSYDSESEKYPSRSEADYDRNDDTKYDKPRQDYYSPDAYKTSPDDSHHPPTTKPATPKGDYYTGDGYAPSHDAPSYEHDHDDGYKPSKPERPPKDSYRPDKNYDSDRGDYKPSNPNPAPPPPSKDSHGSKEYLPDSYHGDRNSNTAPTPPSKSAYDKASDKKGRQYKPDLPPHLYKPIPPKHNKHEESHYPSPPSKGSHSYPSPPPPPKGDYTPPPKHSPPSAPSPYAKHDHKPSHNEDQDKEHYTGYNHQAPEPYTKHSTPIPAPPPAHKGEDPDDEYYHGASESDKSESPGKSKDTPDSGEGYGEGGDEDDSPSKDDSYKGKDDSPYKHGDDSPSKHEDDSPSNYEDGISDDDKYEARDIEITLEPGYDKHKHTEEHDGYAPKPTPPPEAYPPSPPYPHAKKGNKPPRKPKARKPSRKHKHMPATAVAMDDISQAVMQSYGASAMQAADAAAAAQWPQKQRFQLSATVTCVKNPDTPYTQA